MNCKDIKGFEYLYTITDCGKVFNFNTGRGLKFDKSGKSGKYFRVTLSRNGETFRFPVHRLVAMHFVEGFEEGLEVNHIDGDPSNNHFENLEWVTPSENRQHAIDNGLNPKGESHGNSKYNEQQVLMIHNLTSRGFSRAECAEMSKTTLSFVKDVRAGRTWKHVNR